MPYLHAREACIARRSTDRHERETSLALVNQSDAQHRLHEALGAVVSASASLSVAIERTAVVVTEDDLIGFVLVDQTLGGQVSSLEKLVRATNGDGFIFTHPPISKREREDLLDLLKRAKGIVARRNRVVHDEWFIFAERTGPVRGEQDLTEAEFIVEGGRATRISSSTTRTDLATLRRFADHIVALVHALDVVSDAIDASRPDGGDYPMPDVYDAYVERFRMFDDAIKAEAANSWMWEEQPNPFHPSAGERARRR